MNVSLAALFRRYRHAIMRSAQQIVHDAQVAEDLAQEAFMRTRSAIEAGRVEQVEAYLHQTARNLAIDHRRRLLARRQVEASLPGDAEPAQVADGRPSAETVLIDRQRLASFGDALRSLPERARTVLVLSRIHGWTNARIAAHLGVSERTVFNDLKLALGHCADALNRHDTGGRGGRSDL